MASRVRDCAMCAPSSFVPFGGAIGVRLPRPSYPPMKMQNKCECDRVGGPPGCLPCFAAASSSHGLPAWIKGPAGAVRPPQRCQRCQHFKQSSRPSMAGARVGGAVVCAGVRMPSRSCRQIPCSSKWGGEPACIRAYARKSTRWGRCAVRIETKCQGSQVGLGVLPGRGHPPPPSTHKTPPWNVAPAVAGSFDFCKLHGGSLRHVGGASAEWGRG